MQDKTERPPAPYRVTPVFTHETLPQALRSAHATKPGVWGLINVIEGSLRYTIEESGEARILTAPATALIEPAQRHSVIPLGTMAMQIEFFHHAPLSIL